MEITEAKHGQGDQLQIANVQVVHDEVDRCQQLSTPVGLAEVDLRCQKQRICR